MQPSFSAGDGSALSRLPCRSRGRFRTANCRSLRSRFRFRRGLRAAGHSGCRDHVAEAWYVPVHVHDVVCVLGHADRPVLLHREDQTGDHLRLRNPDDVKTIQDIVGDLGKEHRNALGRSHAVDLACASISFLGVDLLSDRH